MKRILTGLVIAMMACGSAMAQKTFTTRSGVTFPANEISASAFGVNLPEMAVILGGAIGEAITCGKAGIDKINATGAFGVQYDRYLCPIVAVGVTGTVEHYKISFKDSSNDSSSTLFCLMPEVKLSWFRKEHVSMYSRVAAGAGYYASDDNDFMFACQVSPVCLEAGGNRVKGFFELGFGMQGSGAGIRFSF